MGLLPARVCAERTAPRLIFLRITWTRLQSQEAGPGPRGGLLAPESEPPSPGHSWGPGSPFPRSRAPKRLYLCLNIWGCRGCPGLGVSTYCRCRWPRGWDGSPADVCGAAQCVPLRGPLLQPEPAALTPAQAEQAHRSGARLGACALEGAERSPPWSALWPPFVGMLACSLVWGRDGVRAGGPLRRRRCWQVCQSPRQREFSLRSRALGSHEGRRTHGWGSAGGGVGFLLKDLEEGGGETRLGAWTG